MLFYKFPDMKNSVPPSLTRNYEKKAAIYYMSKKMAASMPINIAVHVP